MIETTSNTREDVLIKTTMKLIPVIKKDLKDLTSIIYQNNNTV